MLTRILRERTLAGALAAGMVACLPGVASAGADLQLVAVDRVKTIDLSTEDLAALPQATILTGNEFVDGKVAYRGPLVRDVLDQMGLGRAEVLRFVAANDYFVDIPTEDFQKFDVILALEADGKRLSRRDKGPIWLMYPISDHAELNDPLYLRRLIWQVVRIEAL